MQLFAGEWTNQNREYYKVNDNIENATRHYLTSGKLRYARILVRGILLQGIPYEVFAFKFRRYYFSRGFRF